MSAPVPFDWWWSGKFWYCRVDQKVRSGCGLTKPQAAHDAMRELQLWQRKRQPQPGSEQQP